MAAISLTWYLCDLVTGTVLTELPLRGAEQLEIAIAREDTQGFMLDIADPSCPDDWSDLLVNGKTMIVLVIDDQPAQAWVVDEYTVGDVTIPINATTLEECLHRTNVPDLPDPDDLLATGEYDDVDGCVALCAPLIPRFSFVIEHTTAGRTSLFNYANAEDRNLLDVMNERAAADNPIEWRTSVRWVDETHRVFEKVLEIRPSIGVDRPDAVFDLDAGGHGCIESYKRVKSFTQGKGATMLIGTSEGTGSTRPVTDPIYSALTSEGWPVWEERSNFTGLDPDATDEDQMATLVARATARLTQRQHGAITWSIVAGDNAPRPGVDYAEGDTIHIDVAPQQGVRGDGTAYWLDQTGGTAAVRVLGWQLDTISGQSTPILKQGDEP